METNTKENKEELEKTVEEENSSPDLIKEAKEAIAELKVLNAEKKALLEREERLASHNLLSGKANAGRAMKQEETNVEYKDRVMRGEVKL